MASMSRQLFTVVSLLLFLSSSLLLSSSFVHAELFSAPSLKWSLQLEGSGRLSGRGLRKGNAVVAYKDGTKIIVTADDGSLHIIQTTDQVVKTLSVYVPDGIVGRYMECRSGATVVDANIQDGHYIIATTTDSANTNTNNEVAKEEDYIIYAVIDNTVVPDVGIFNSGMISSIAGNENNNNNNNFNNIVSSRVIAVNMDGTFKWSVEVQGRIEGNPIVGKTGLYVTHNDNGIGHLSVIRINNNTNDGTQTTNANIVATVSPPATKPGSVGPLGPPAIQKPEYQYDEQSEEDEDSLSLVEDVVIVAENWESGFSESKGGLYMLSLSSSSSSTTTSTSAPSTSTSAYELVKISSWSYSASAPPLVYGDSIFLGAAGGTLVGYTGDRKYDLSAITSGREKEIWPRWDFQMTPNPRNASQPLLSQPIMDSEGNYLFVPGVDSDFYCLQSDNGRQLWKDEEGSQIMARPRVFEGEDDDDWKKVVYVVESLNGRVRQYDLYSGQRYWDYSCADISDQLCQDAVEAEFAITPSGNTIYYGDIYGRINSLEVANFATEKPTIAPSSASSDSPTGMPTIASAPSGAPVVATTTADPTAITVVASVPINDDATFTPTFVVIDYDDNDGADVVEEDITNSNEEPSAIIDQQSAKKEDSSTHVALYIGVAIAGLCVLMIPILLFSVLRRRKRNEPTKSKEMLVEIIDDCSSGDLESQSDLDHFSSNSSGRNNDFDPYNGDGIEVEIRSPVTPTRAAGTPTKKKKKRKKRRSNLPDTPNTVNTLESIEELPEEASAMVVMGGEFEYDIEDPSVEAVNLRQTFERVADTDVAPGEVCMGAGSNHLELSIGKISYGENEGNVNDSSFLGDDDEVPPPPPLPSSAPVSTSSRQWTWGSLLQMGTSQSMKKINSSSPQMTVKKLPSEKLELKRTTRAISPSSQEESISTKLLTKTPSSSSITSTRSQDEISSDGRTPSQKETGPPPITKLKWKKKSMKDSSTTPPLVLEKDANMIDRAETHTTTNQIATDSETSPTDELIGQIAPEQFLADQKKSQIPEIANRETTQPSLPPQGQKENHSSATKDTEEEKKGDEEELHSRSQTPVPPTPASPSALSILSDAVLSLSPGRSVRSIQESLFASPHRSPSGSSVGSNDDSLYTSYTAMTGGTRDKKEDTKDLSPFSSYVYDEDIRRRDRAEIANEADGILAQPDLSKSKNAVDNNGKYRYPDEEEEHPHDESAASTAAPGIQYMSHTSEETKAQKYGKSVRSKRDSNSFRSSTSSRNESGSTPLAQMYDQLAAMGQQKKEERKPAFKRRSKRLDRENPAPPPHQQEQQGDNTWGSFLDELAEAEKDFFAPSANKSKSLLDGGDSEDSGEDAEIARINNLYNH